MSTLTRKQREVTPARADAPGRCAQDAHRERLRRAEHGPAGRGDRSIRKGPIYQHFSTKEDLVTALASQTMERRTALFARAAKFVGRPRERFMAIGVADELLAGCTPITIAPR